MACTPLAIYFKPHSVNTNYFKMQHYVYILISSLRYEPEPDRVQCLTREQFYSLREKKRERYTYIKRITQKRFILEGARIEREAFSKEYDGRIMKKYSVGANYQSNRWFMEQIRPTL